MPFPALITSLRILIAHLQKPACLLNECAPPSTSSRAQASYLPVTSYLTMLDYYMTSTFCLLFLVSLQNLTVCLLSAREDDINADMTAMAFNK